MLKYAAITYGCASWYNDTHDLSVVVGKVLPTKLPLVYLK